MKVILWPVLGLIGLYGASYIHGEFFSNSTEPTNTTPTFVRETVDPPNHQTVTRDTEQNYTPGFSKYVSSEPGFSKYAHSDPGEVLYNAILSGDIKIEDLNEKGLQILEAYLEEKVRLSPSYSNIFSTNTSYSDPYLIEETEINDSSTSTERWYTDYSSNGSYQLSPDYYQTESDSDRSIGRLTSNPYSGYSNPYDPDSVNNPYGTYDSPYSPYSATNPYATNTPELYDSNGNYRGKLSSNPYDPDSISNPYGRYGSPYSPDSINNPYGAGSPYQYDSPNNPYGSGWTIKAPD